MASNQVFLVIPGVSLMINISLLRKVTNDTNKKKILSLLHSQGIMELLFVIIIGVLPC